MKKKILLGPFVGEFGWEYSFFSGYANEIYMRLFSEFEVHVASYAGRKNFYDENIIFHSHPDWFTDLNLSQHGYIADNWVDLWPKNSNLEGHKDIMNRYLELKRYYENAFGPFDKILSPAELFECPLNSNHVYGTYLPSLIYIKNKKLNQLLTRYIYPIYLRLESFHSMKQLMPTNEGRTLFSKKYQISETDQFICLFPRKRVGRRPEKNWGIDNYNSLINGLSNYFPSHKILLLGEPNGSCYVNSSDFPEKCLDLINIDKSSRLDIHLAALERSTFAVGGLSGALLIALGSKTPVIEWGSSVHKPETERLNWLGTPLCYIEEINPKVNYVLECINNFVENNFHHHKTYSDTIHEITHYDSKLEMILRTCFYKFFKMVLLARIYIRGR